MEFEKVGEKIVPFMYMNVTSHPFNCREDASNWKMIRAGSVANNEKEVYDIISELLKSAYEDILNRKIKFDNIPDFDMKFVELIMGTDSTDSGVYYKTPSGGSVSLIHIYEENATVYGNEDAIVFFYDDAQLVKYGDKYYLFEFSDLEDDFGNSLLKISMDFDASMPIDQIIMKAAEHFAYQNSYDEDGDCEEDE